MVAVASSSPACSWPVAYTCNVYAEVARYLARSSHPRKSCSRGSVALKRLGLPYSFASPVPYVAFLELRMALKILVEYSDGAWLDDA